MKGMKIENNTVTLLINPKVYPIEVIYSAAYVFLDKAYILLDGDPKKEISIQLKLKKTIDKNNISELEKLGCEFLNELINYADYKERAKETKNIREALLQRALITNDPTMISNNQSSSEDNAEFEKILKELDEKGDELFNDKKGIAIPWEEKYGKKSEQKKIQDGKNKKNKTK